MKTTMKFLTMITLALCIGVTTTSCSGDDGDIGIAGVDGTDGQDGNANVQTYTFDVSAESGTDINLSLSAITQDVLDNDVILHYLSRASGNRYPVPGIGFNAYHQIRVFNSIGSASFRFLDFSGASFSITVGTYDIARIIIIESSNTTAGRSSLTLKQQIYSELENAGIDVNDYYAVMDYYGLDY